MADEQRGAGVLPASAGLFRALFEQSPQSVQVLAPTGETVAVNRAWEELWGVTLADLPGYNVLEDPQLEANGVAPVLRRAFAGERVELPAVAYVPDRGAHGGTARWVRAVAAPVLDETGDVAQVILVHEDVTEVVAAGERLDRTRELLEESQRSARVGTWEWDVRTGGLTWTDELYRIFGLEPGTPVGYDRFLAAVHPDDRPTVAAAVEAALRDGRAFAFHHRIVRPDGATRWLQGRGRVVLGEGGAPVRLVGSGQDVSERVEAEAARERALAAQQALAEAGRAFAEAEPDAPGLLEIVARHASAAVGDGCTIWLLEDGGERLRPAALHHPDPEVLAAARAAFAGVDHDAARGILGRVATTGQPAFVPVLDPAALRDHAHPAYRDLLERHPAYGLLAAPMRARGRVVGVIAASRSTPGRPYDAVDLALLREFADRAALALDNARLARDAQAAERRYRGLFEGVADAVLVADADGRYLDANPAAAALLGYEREELLGLRVPDVVAWREQWTEAEYARFTAEGAWRGELELRRKDGSTVPVEAVATAVRLPDGPVYLSAVRDVSARRRAEADLRRLAAIVESSEDAIISRTLEGTITTWNRGAERLYGYASEEAVGLHVSALLPPERQHELPQISERLTRNERMEHFETVRLRKDGSRVGVSISLSPIADAAGRVVGVSTIARDVTERRRAEERQRFLAEASAVLASSLDYETTLAAVADLAVHGLADWCAVDVIDEDGTTRRLAVAHVDPAQVARARELQGRYPPDPEAPHGVPAVLRTGRAELYPEVPDELLVAAARDAEHLALLRAVGVRSMMIVPLVARARTLGAISLVAAESGRGYDAADLALAEDLARRAALAVDNARLYRQAQEAVRDRERFLSVAAHELRSPITKVWGFAQLLQRGRERRPPEQIANWLGAINEACSRLSTLVDDLLDVSRLQSGQLPLRPERLDLAALARQAIERQRTGAGGHHRFIVEAPEAPCWVLADPDRIGQVVDNLLDNAVKYSPAGGEVIVSVRPDRDGVELAVRDRGIGLPAGGAEAIFAPFGRAANAEAQGAPGLGLGLYISRGIVERHGGRIRAESPGEGRGTTLAVWLPRGEARPAADGTPDPGTRD